jgi:hypothetical protein
MVTVARMIVLTLAVIAAVSATPRAEAHRSVNPMVGGAPAAGRGRIGDDQDALRRRSERAHAPQHGAGPGAMLAAS